MISIIFYSLCPHNISNNAPEDAKVKKKKLKINNSKTNKDRNVQFAQEKCNRYRFYFENKAKNNARIDSLFLTYR